MKRNAEIIVKYATAYPFQHEDSMLLCIYCGDKHPNPVTFRQHMREEHKGVNKKLLFHKISLNNLLKLDCTELSCRICQIKHNNLQDMSQHLFQDHKLKLHLENGLDLLPYYMDNDKLLCGVCEINHSCLRNLSRHVKSHFKKFTCESCGKSYNKYSSLKAHSITCNVKDKYICVKCKMSFDSLKDRRNHYLVSKSCWCYVCDKCPERLRSWDLKQKHMLEAHSIPKRIYKCLECSKVLSNYRSMRQHFAANHKE